MITFIILVLVVLIAILLAFAQEAVPLAIVFAIFIGGGMLITRIIDKMSLSQVQKEKLYRWVPFIIVGIVILLLFGSMGVIYLILK